MHFNNAALGQDLPSSSGFVPECSKMIRAPSPRTAVETKQIHDPYAPSYRVSLHISRSVVGPQRTQIQMHTVLWYSRAPPTVLREQPSFHAAAALSASLVGKQQAGSNLGLEFTDLQNLIDQPKAA